MIPKRKLSLFNRAFLELAGVLQESANLFAQLDVINALLEAHCLNVLDLEGVPHERPSRVLRFRSGEAGRWAAGRPPGG